MTHKVIVLGAGISGLSAAWFLKQRGCHVTLLEASTRVGGYVDTSQDHGFLFEMGPRSCRTNGNGLETLALIEKLGLKDQVVKGESSAKKRFLYTQRRLQPLPTGPLSFVTSPLTRPLLWPLLKEWKAPICCLEDESIHSFVERRLGAYAANTFVDPLVSGIFAGDSRKLSIKSCFPFLHECERNQGSILKGILAKRSTKPILSPFVKEVAKAGIFSLRKGMQQLVSTLANQLTGCIQMQSEVASLDLESLSVMTSSGERYSGDYIVSALPSKALSRLVSPYHSQAAQELSCTDCSSVAVVALGYRRNVLNHEGFGYLIPSQEGERTLGVVWDSSVFPQQNRHSSETRLTCMIGGQHMHNFDSYEVDDFVSIALEALRRQMGIKVTPDAVAVKLTGQAIPQYGVGHSRRIQEIRKGLKTLNPNLILLGSSFDGVAINDCIANSKAAVGGIVLANEPLGTSK